MRVPFGNLPDSSALFMDYSSGWSGIPRFYPRSYSIESIVSFARERPRLDGAHRGRLCAALSNQQKRWGSHVDASLEKLANGAAVIITGQQCGLFSGPFYSILKAITAIKLAKEVEKCGVPAVPVFWLASEDHDHEEIRWASVIDRDSRLQRLQVELANGDATPAGWLQFRDDVSGAVSQCLSSLPDSEFHRDVRELLESSYQPGVSPSDAFAQMFAALFAKTGLIIVDPLDSELKSLAAPLLAEAVKRNGEIRSAVLARSKELSSAGYHEQVKVDEHFTGLFAYRGRSRKILRPNELSMDVPLSPNVLLRPAVQDSIFPTAAYVGGPAEVAYFAQAAAAYETLGMPVPPVFPRISATVMEARVSRPMKKYGMEFADALRGREYLKVKAVASVRGVELFDQMRDNILAQLEVVAPALRAVDPTLLGALETSRQKMVHQVETLRTRFVNAEAKRNETLDRHLDAISNSLFPEKRLQERVINVSSFLMRYGLGFIGQLDGRLSLDSREHQVVEI